MRIFLLLIFFVQLKFGFALEKFNNTAVANFQRQINSEYADSKTCPLMQKNLTLFKILDFYPAGKKQCVEAKFVRITKENPSEMKTTSDRKLVYVKHGELDFVMDEANPKLNTYKNCALLKQKESKDYLFLSFLDFICGRESDTEGKYIDVKIPHGNKMIVNFNTAYNPNYACNHEYSCPLVAVGNDLNTAIQAVVKKING